MYLMYVDESGDTGLSSHLNHYYALSGIVIHESNWQKFGQHIYEFRRTLRERYKLPIRTEIHSVEYIRRPPVPGIQKHERLAILRNFMDELAKLDFISVTNILVNKSNKPEQYDVFDNAWRCLFQRFENTMKYGNFPGGYKKDYGIVITDNTNGGKLQTLIRKMGAHNPVPHKREYGDGYRNMPIVRVIEDPHLKDSKDSYFVQACDVCAYFLLQKYAPNSYVRRNGAHHYVERLLPILNQKASTSHPLGVVEL